MQAVYIINSVPHAAVWVQDDSACSSKLRFAQRGCSVTAKVTKTA